jgi:hypothetical protein
MTEHRQQIQGLRIQVVDPDDDYLGIDIQAANNRFAGTARIYAGLNELSEFADQIRGFPANIHDERTYEFGSPDPSLAGGYCKLRFQCVDHAGHAVVVIVVEDDGQRYPHGNAELSFGVEAAEIDRFVARLGEVEQERSGEAVLTATEESTKWFWWRTSRPSRGQPLDVRKQSSSAG